VKVETYTGLTIEFCKKMNARFILRGLRTSADFEFEKSIAQNNKIMYPEIETIFILPVPELSAINSTIVRDIIRNNGDASPFVPKGIDLKAQ
jgi:pantetheine-phosphate adenylyltransferase